MKMTKLSVDQIEPLRRRVRAVGLDVDAVARYLDCYRDPIARAEMPPIVVFNEARTQSYIVADGEHRLEAAKRAKLKVLDVDLRSGDHLAALRFALGCNVRHGVPRTQADCWHNYCLLMDTPELCDEFRTDQQKADAIGVHRNTILNYHTDYRDSERWSELTPTNRRMRLKEHRAAERAARDEVNDSIVRGAAESAPEKPTLKLNLEPTPAPSRRAQLAAQDRQINRQTLARLAGPELPPPVVPERVAMPDDSHEIAVRHIAECALFGNCEVTPSPTRREHAEEIALMEMLAAMQRTQTKLAAAPFAFNAACGDCDGAGCSTCGGGYDRDAA